MICIIIRRFRESEERFKDRFKIGFTITLKCFNESIFEARFVNPGFPKKRVKERLPADCAMLSQKCRAWQSTGTTENSLLLPINEVQEDRI